MRPSWAVLTLPFCLLAADSSYPPVQFTRTAGGLQSPTSVSSAHDGSGRLFITEQRGRVRIVRGVSLLSAPFLDLSAQVTPISDACCDERGLLSIAFPPGFGAKQYFYVAYTDSKNTIVVSRFRVSADPDRADPASETVILKIEHFYENHFGGQLAFSPIDRQLYYSLGDGAGGGDPLHAAQDPDKPYGKIWRIDVENGATEPELVALGLRNPWRFSFDSQTGDLYIGDVGENRFEEIDLRPHDAAGVSNFGWPIMEGFHYLQPGIYPEAGILTPIYEYPHSDGCAVISASVYRGAEIPGLRGAYLFADFCQGHLWALHWQPDGWKAETLVETGRNLSAFGEDEAGEIVAVDFIRGELYRLGPIADDGETGEPPEYRRRDN